LKRNKKARASRAFLLSELALYQKTLAPPQFVLPFVAFQVAAVVAPLVQAGDVAEPSVGAVAPAE
jgi:hypothetical protein